MEGILGQFVQPSFPAFLTIFIFTNLLICAIYVIFKNNSYLHNMGVYLFPFCLIILGIRLALPLELRYSKSYYFKGIYHKIIRFLEDDRFGIGSIDMSIVDILAVIVIMGILVKLIIFLKKYREFCDKICITSKKCKNIDRVALSKALLKYKNKCNFELLRSDFISTPIIFGLLHPCIVLPNKDYGIKQLEYMLSHEVAHYYRKDLWTRLMVELVGIVYWWSPFIYLLKEDIIKYLELRTDLVVVRDLDNEEKSAYSNCLLMVFKDVNKSNIKLSGNIVAFGNDEIAVLKQRISMVKDTYKPSMLKKIAVMIPMVMILATSYLVVLEPSGTYVNTRDEFIIDESCAYVVEKEDGRYDIYVFDEYFETVDDLKYNFNQMEDSFGRVQNSILDLKIYKSCEEAIKDEKKFV